MARKCSKGYHKTGRKGSRNRRCVKNTRRRKH